LRTCQANYAVSSDGTKCEPTATTASASGVFDCNNEFAFDDTMSCLSGEEAGVKWTWGNNAKTYCQRQIKYYKVDMVSAKDQAKKFTTYLPRESMEAGIKGLIAGWVGDVNVEFTVDAFDSSDRSLFKYPRRKPLTIAGSGVTCRSIGITPTDAFKYWNENDNISEVTWYMRPGSLYLGSFATYDMKTGGILSDTDWKAITATDRKYIPSGEFGVITNCNTGLDVEKQTYDWSSISQFAPHINIEHECGVSVMWLNDSNYTWKDFGPNKPIKSTLPI